MNVAALSAAARNLGAGTVCKVGAGASVTLYDPDQGDVGVDLMARAGTEFIQSAMGYKITSGPALVLILHNGRRKNARDRLHSHAVGYG